MPEVMTVRVDPESVNAFATTAAAGPTYSVTIPDGTIQFSSVTIAGTSTLISETERAVLKKLLDRNRTSMAVHGGLKSLFVLSDEEASALLGFLERI